MLNYSFITREEYDSLYPGNDMTEDVFKALSVLGSDLVDELCMYRIGGPDGFAKLSPPNQTLVKKAVAAQVSTMDEQGGMAVVQGWGADSAQNSERIGKYSYSGGTSAGGGGLLQTLRGIPLSPLLQTYLFPTGMMNRAAGVIC